MQELLETYLFRNRECLLPGIGVLRIIETPAEYVHSNQHFTAPSSFVSLLKEEKDPGNIIRYLAQAAHMSTAEAAEKFHQYCLSIRKLAAGDYVSWPHTGRFAVAEDGELTFECISLPAAFFSPAPALRVLRRDVSHDVLVGDTQTTSADMAAYYNKTETPLHRRWLWGAAVLFIIALVVIIVYVITSGNGSFGNALPVQPVHTTGTYRAG